MTKKRSRGLLFFTCIADKAMSTWWVSDAAKANRHNKTDCKRHAWDEARGKPSVFLTAKSNLIVFDGDADQNQLLR